MKNKYTLIIMKIVLVLLFLPCMAFAQKKSSTLEHPITHVSLNDTLTIELTDIENAILKEYMDQYNDITNTAQQQQKLSQQRLQQIADAYRNVVKMKIESIGGDSKKYFDVKDKRLIYLGKD